MSKNKNGNSPIAVIWKIDGPIPNYYNSSTSQDNDNMNTFIVTLRSHDELLTFRHIALTDWLSGTTRGIVAEYVSENLPELWEKAK